MLAGCVTIAASLSNEIMGKVSENYQPLPREELGDLDEAKWERKGEGRHTVPLDPWHETYDVVVSTLDDLDNRPYLHSLSFEYNVYNNRPYLHLLSFDYDDDKICGDWISKNTESLGRLCQIYAAHARRVPDELPIIELTSRVLTHPVCGVVAIPQINIVGWWSEEKEKSIAALTKRPEEAKVTRPRKKGKS